MPSNASRKRAKVSPAARQQQINALACALSRCYVKYKKGQRVRFKGRVYTVAWVLLRRSGLYLFLPELGEFVPEESVRVA